MAAHISLADIVAQAKRKGYFDPQEFSGISLSHEQFAELMALLVKYRLPYGKPQLAKDIHSTPELDQPHAKRIITALRRGVPADSGTQYYSAGRDTLLEQVGEDLTAVESDRSLVRFLNADIGQGKTHILYQLREQAFVRDFAVSVVTLSQHSCPLYDFMRVYHEIMWTLRIADQRQSPALSNVIDRWIERIRRLPKSQIHQIVEHGLPSDLREVMGAYAEVTNLIRPNEEKRQLILKFLSGEKLLVRELRALNISTRITSENSLHMLGQMAKAIRYIGFKGICILFDEAEGIHSFSSSLRRDAAFANLRQIVQQSQQFPHCYFVYATTPSFFDDYSSAALQQELGIDGIIELEPLGVEEQRSIGAKIASIYGIAMGWDVPADFVSLLQDIAKLTPRVGDYVRQCIGLLDEASATIGR